MPNAPPIAQKMLADQAYSGGQGVAFVIWASAQIPGIAIRPFGLPHAIAVCGTTISVPELRKLGAPHQLLESIEKAHEQGLYDSSLPVR